MAETSVKMRSDLEVQWERDSGIIVKDPVTHRFYRFSLVQASALARLTGLQDYDSIAADVSREQGVEATTEQIEEFVPMVLPVLSDTEGLGQELFHNLIDARAGGFGSLLEEFFRFLVDAVDGDRFHASSGESYNDSYRIIL